MLRIILLLLLRTLLLLIPLKRVNRSRNLILNSLRRMPLHISPKRLRLKTPLHNRFQKRRMPLHYFHRCLKLLGSVTE